MQPRTRAKRIEFERAVHALEPAAVVIFADRLPCAYAIALQWWGWILVDRARLKALSREEIKDLAAHEVAHLRVWRTHPGAAVHGREWHAAYQEALDEIDDPE